MYIRRKVFSVVVDETTGEQKLFSTNEIMDEEAYLQKIYAEAEEEETSSKKANAKEIAKEAGKGAAVGASGAGAILGGMALGGKVAKNMGRGRELAAAKARRKVIQEGNTLAQKELQKWGGRAVGREQAAKIMRNAAATAKNTIKAADAGKAEKAMASASKFVKNNKAGAAAVIAAAALTAGAANAGAKAYKRAKANKD